MKENKLLFFYLIASALAFLYVLIRANNVGITYDEVWTINNFVPQSIIHILNFTPCDANNHILNTLLIKLFYSSGEQSIFIARLPNLLSFIFYLFFSYKITFNFLSARLGIITFLLLLLNPFLLDFFSLARGYGMSLSFQLASIYYLILFLKEKSHARHSITSLILAAIAVLANLSVLNFYLAVIITGNMHLIVFKKENFRKNALYSFLITGILTLMIWEPVRKLKRNGNLYYGGAKNFYEDTIVSLAKYTSYSSEISRLTLTALHLLLLIFCVAVLLSFLKRQKSQDVKNILLSVLFLSTLSVILQHYMLNSLYIIDRSALFFYPLFILALCFSIDCLTKNWYSQIMPFLLLASFAINFFTCANVYKTAIWFFDARSLEILNKINNEGSAQNRKMKIDFSWPFQSSFGYYLNKYDYPFIEIIKKKIDRTGFNADFDYYIYLNKSLEKVDYEVSGQKITTYKKDTVAFDNEEEIYIFKHTR